MSTIETISLTVPPEPADKSVVLGKDGTAWQRDLPCWRPAIVWADAKHWVDLLVEHGPVTVLYYATEDEL